MPFGYSDIKPIPNFESEEEEFFYAKREAEAYFKERLSAEYAIWSSNGMSKFLFIADFGGSIYIAYRLGERIDL